jgi:metal-responsive CopG/Arc/MetJ family transcriptional regulator
MAVINVSIPDDLKKAFDKAFKGMNKSAVVAEMMRRAIEEQERKQRLKETVAGIRAIAAAGPPVSTEEILRILDEVRGK